MEIVIEAMTRAATRAAFAGPPARRLAQIGGL
jgi:hypothetical protein